MSSVFESVAGSGYHNTIHGPRPAPAQWGAIRTIAKWLGFAETTNAPECAASDERRKRQWDRQGMLAAGNEMLARCRRDDLPLSMAVFCLDDLPQVRTFFGSEVAQQLLLKTLGKLNHVASSNGLAVRTGATTFAVLLPELDHDHAVAVVHQVLGDPCRIELDASESGVGLDPAFMVKTASKDDSSAEEIYQALRRDMSLTRLKNKSSQGHVAPSAASLPILEALLAAGESARTQSAGCTSFDPTIATVPMPLAAMRGEQNSASPPMELTEADNAAYCCVAATIPMPIGAR
jgi:GGDEF domain-containing protein